MDYHRASTSAHRYGHKTTKPRKLPINLLRKAIRERRNRNVSITPKQHKIKKRPRNFERSEHEALVQATEQELKRILEGVELLSDIAYDCTPEELLGEIAIAKGHATTVSVQRDGLSTLTIVLHQQNPTIAHLKRAIESIARVQQKRELRERYEERLQRRRETIADEERKPAASEHACPAAVLEPPKNTGELVCSAARFSHHRHRPNVSWRYLWRAYALFNVDTNVPINDENGRKLLTECGIENASTLKFTNREKYFGRKRQS